MTAHPKPLPPAGDPEPQEVSRIYLGEIPVEVVQKAIKNVHLSVYPPTGQVRIAAPSRMDLDTIRVFAVSKLAWIKEQQEQLQNQARESPRQFVNRESHHLWGRRYLMTLLERQGRPEVVLGPRRMTFCVRPGTDRAKKQSLIDRWYRDQIRAKLPRLLKLWQPILGVEAQQVFVRRMKTKWGSCNPTAGNILLNTELAKKPPECLEYILVHELVHLLEPTHNERFANAMDKVMPQWRHHRRVLNELPIRRESWTY